METTILIIIFLLFVLVCVIYINVKQREDNAKLEKMVKKITNPIFFARVAPYELVSYYARLYKLADKKAEEYRIAFLSLNLEWSDEMHKLSIEPTYLNSKDVVDAYMNKQLLSRDWTKAENKIPYIPLAKINEDEERFKTAFSAAFQSL